ncbi:MAG: hypothetical protein ACJ76M_17780, partial [Solirubrobacteraceae bacterium]
RFVHIEQEQLGYRLGSRYQRLEIPARPGSAASYLAHAQDPRAAPAGPRLLVTRCTAAPRFQDAWSYCVERALAHYPTASTAATRSAASSSDCGSRTELGSGADVPDVAA